MPRRLELSTRTKRAAIVGGFAYLSLLLLTPSVMGFGGDFSLASFLGALFDVQVGPWL